MKDSPYKYYLEMKAVPAGAVLRYILRAKAISNLQLADMASMLPQRISDLIHGNRRFSVEVSLTIESCLDIDIPGFFYAIQAKHDIYVERIRRQSKPDLGLLSKTTFWDANMNSVDWIKSKKWVIERVLSYGTEKEIDEISRFYGQSDVDRAKSSLKKRFRSDTKKPVLR